eukprot:Phypoly_transcript_30992.p1 GENE.Phypoly_transcript_30992~~Phypoly_transcript_30992.p1  ORF type:complete len:100 (+),score=0.42 Phypoly_transcript_30992:62-361(+)
MFQSAPPFPFNFTISSLLTILTFSPDRHYVDPPFQEGAPTGNYNCLMRSLPFLTCLVQRSLLQAGATQPDDRLCAFRVLCGGSREKSVIMGQDILILRI